MANETSAHPIPTWHLLLALGVVAIWGTNFVVIHEGLEQFPPLTFAALRFLLTAIPAVLFLRRPTASPGQIIAYGLLIGVGQFGLLYLAMNGRITPGLASLLIQAQVFMTVLLSAVIARERIKRVQWLALAICLLGIGIIATGVEGSASTVGLALVLTAAASWACANLISRRTDGQRMVSFIVWSSLSAVPPLTILALLVDGPERVVSSIMTAGAGAWASVMWQSVGNTLFGYAAWSWLLARHPAASITPMALLVPVFGMSASAIILDEPMPGWKWLAATLIILGLAVNMAAPVFSRAVSGARREQV